jgi:phosphatidylserine decarboxylase
MNTVLLISFLLLLLFAFWRFIFFFRNPERTSSADDNAILSPADGHVLYIKYVQHPDTEVFSIKNERKILLHELMLLRRADTQLKTGWLIGIVMSPLDVHYNRSPVSGFIRRIGYEFPSTLRKNFSMFPALQNLFFKNYPPQHDCTYLIYNERASYMIVNYKNDVTISRGEVFGMIRMGSQVDIFIPDSNAPVQVMVKVREHIKAGKDVIAFY